MRRNLNSVLILCLIFVTCCTKKTAKELKIEELEQKIKKTEAEITSIDDKIAAEKSNPGLQYSLGQQKELAKSRLERLKYNLILISGKKTKTAEE